jgi:hypothetical protein
MAVGLPTRQRARNVDESCARAMGETVGDDQRDRWSGHDDDNDAGSDVGEVER